MASRNKNRKSAPVASDAERQQFAQVKSTGLKSVCFFNNKGGVGKTTLVANLAAELATGFGAKILVVDADPQCNLTQYVLSEEEITSLYKKDDIASIHSFINPLHLGKGFETNLPVRKASEFGFDLIVGDPRLALREDFLAQDWRDARAGGIRGIRTTFVFSDLLAKAAERKYDFVFFDMGPSLGAINRSILLVTDYFIVPMGIDIFSIWAIKNIGQVITTWQKELRSGIAMAEDVNELPSGASGGSIGFLGYVTQQHKERMEGGNPQIVQAYKDIGEKIPREIADFLGTLMSKNIKQSHLGDIKHLGSLAPKSQTMHVPMISVSAVGNYASLRKQAREIYRSIAIRFLENLSAAIHVR